MDSTSEGKAPERASPVWAELAAQQLVRYQALFSVLDEIQAMDDISAIAARVAKRWKYIANVSCWRLVIAKDESFLVIDGRRGEAEVSEMRALSSWDDHHWKQQRPALVHLVKGGAMPAPPDHLAAGGPTAEIAVVPFFRMGCYIGLLSAVALRPPFSDLDSKFIRLFGSYFADRIAGIVLQKQAMDILTTKATIDDLTGLPNRRAILDRLGSELALGRRTRQPLSIILLDIDFFKKINDTYGHLAGDAVLREVAHRLQAETRRNDSVGRYGGEEFVVVLYPCTQEEAANMAERIRLTVADAPFRIGGAGPADYKVTVSLGTATSPRCGDVAMEALIKRADDALYQSKAGGRNRVTASGEPG